MTRPRAGFASRFCFPDLFASPSGDMSGCSFGTGRVVSRWKRSTLRALAVSLLVLVAALPSLAATYTVTSTADSGTGSLRAALGLAANGDTIIFSLTYPATITLTSGTLTIGTNLTISGPGAANLFISGNNAYTVFQVNPGVTATISSVTIENGTCNSLTCLSGGGIQNNGTLTVSNSTLSGNSAGVGTLGGGIFNNNGATLTVSNSTLSGNSGGVYGGNAGGGIFNDGGTLTVSNSTLSANSADQGGGIFNYGGTLTVSNSTLSANTAGSQGGGIFNTSTLTVSDSTLSGNSSASLVGGGIFNTGTLTLKSTLLANESSGGNCVLYSGTATSEGYNLSDDSSCTFLTATGDQNDVPAGLDTTNGLRNNGGPTSTIALVSNSTAIDAIPVNECTDAFGNVVATDQRGVSRPQGKGCDIGAYELVQPVPTANVCTAGSPAPCSATITLDYYIPSGTTLATTPVSVVTQGAPGLDFTLASGTTCTSGLAGPNPCTVQVTFAPLAPGLRLGAVNLTDSSGNPVASTFISGTGVGPALAFTPGIISTVAGNGTGAGTGLGGYSGDGGPATSAELNNPNSVAVDSAGNLYIADLSNNVIRKVTAATGVITTVAGNGTAGYSGNGGPATSAELYAPFGVALDSAGNLYIADCNNNVVRKVTAATGIITTVAGTGGPGGYSGDGGPATSAELFAPIGVAVDSAGNLYIADDANEVVRKVTAATGTITTVAGNGTAGYNGDGGPATSAELYNPYGGAVDSAGNLYIGDSYNNVVRKITAATGIITTVAGNGTYGYSGDGGPATSAQLYSPLGVAVDSAGNLYIADNEYSIIRKVNANGTITTVAGNGTQGHSGDGGPATSAELIYPSGVAVDGAGNLYIADNSNNRIRKVNVATSALSFPSTNEGQSSATQQVVVSDVGNADLNFSSFGISSNFGLPGPAGGDCLVGTPLTAGADCTLEAYFAPEVSGPITGTISVADNALNSPHLVNLSGTAVLNDFSISASPGTVSVPQGGSGSTAISTALISGSAETVALSVSGLPVGASASFTPTSVTAGGGSTLHLNAGTASPSTYSLTVTGTATSATHTTTVSLTIAPPATVNVTVKSVPSGLLFSSSGTGCASGTGYTTLSTLAWTPGSSCTLAFSTPQAGSPGTRYVFSQWDDSSTNPTRAITAPLVATVYTAAFNTQYLLTTAISPAGTGTIGVSPLAASNYYAPGTPVTLTASPSAGYIFSGWSGTVTSTSNPLVVTMSGPQTVTANFIPALGFVPPSISFGTVTLWGGTSQFLNITNNTSATVKFSKITLSNLVNMTAKDLTYDGGCMSSIAPGKVCKVTLSLWPSKTGAASAILNITGNVTGSPLHVTVTANIIAPKATLNASSLSFGNQKTNTTSAPKTVTLTNNGIGPLTLSPVSVTGSNASDFAISNNTCSSTLSQGSSCLVSVTFTPHSKNSRSATLKFTDNAQSATQTVSLSGKGI